MNTTELAGRCIAGRYDVDALLGIGGLGCVYGATDRHLERRVAIKILTARSEAIRHRFLLEARSLARLNHPGIITVYDAGEHDGISYVVMEFADGPTLQEIAAAGTTCAEAVRVTVELLDGLHYAHERDVLHGDIKPSNIVVRLDGSVKLMDFGLARRISDLSAGTQPGEIFGTIAYLPPERFLGNPTGPSSDLYSVGIVLYELLAGSVPFHSEIDDIVAVVYAHVNQRPEPPSRFCTNITPDLERIVLKLIEKDPASRYQSARELQAALRASPGAPA